MTAVVLDASALLAAIQAEPGVERVAEALPGAAMSAVNLSEVVAKLADWGVPNAEVDLLLAGFGLDIRPFDDMQAVAAGRMRPATRSAGLGLGDRACLALAAALGRPALTADREWLGLPLAVEVRAMR